MPSRVSINNTWCLTTLILNFRELRVKNEAEIVARDSPVYFVRSTTVLLAETLFKGDFVSNSYVCDDFLFGIFCVILFSII